MTRAPRKSSKSPIVVTVLGLALLIAASFLINGINNAVHQVKLKKLAGMVLNAPPGTPVECLKDQKMMMTAGGLINLNTVPYKPGCPGHNPNQDTKVATLTLGDVTFRVPREYIWIGKFELDGPADEIHLMFKYPEMSPGDPDAQDQSHNLLVTIKLSKCTPEKKGCLPLDKAWYKTRVLWLGTGTIQDMRKAIFHPELDMHWFTREQQLLTGPNAGTIDRMQSHDVFFKGSPENPRYWFYCNVTGVPYTNPRCEGVFHLTETVYYEIGFRRTLLPKHAQIKSSVEDKLQEFIVEQNRR